MIKYNCILVLYFNLIFGVSSVFDGVQRKGDIECDNVCYLGLDEDLQHLNDLYNKLPSISNVSSNLDAIHTLINRTENIVLNIKNLDDVKNTSQIIYDTIFHHSRKLELLKNIVDYIILINTKLNELNNRSDVFDKCVQADELYRSLRDDIESIKKLGKDVDTALDVSNRVSEIKDSSLNNKKNLDGLKVFESLFQNYICNSKLQATVQEIINSMGEIATMLRTLFEGIINSPLKTIESDINGNKQNINDIRENFKEEIPKTDVKTAHDTKPILDALRRKLEHLKDKIQEIEMNKSFEDILEDVRKHFKELTKEYEEILNFIFSKQNMKKVQKEIETAKEVLQLLRERDAVKIELEKVKQIVDMLKDRGICFITEIVSVEDEIVI